MAVAVKPRAFALLAATLLILVGFQAAAEGGGLRSQLPEERVLVDPRLLQDAAHDVPAQRGVEGHREEVLAALVDELAMAPSLGRHVPAETGHRPKEAAPVHFPGEPGHSDVHRDDLGGEGAGGLVLPALAEFLQVERDALAGELQRLLLALRIDEEAGEAGDRGDMVAGSRVVLEDHAVLHGGTSPPGGHKAVAVAFLVVSVPHSGPWIFVAHTWLDLEITATDNGLVSKVIFVFKDTNTARDGMRHLGTDTWGTTFEIDFWGDYMAGYEVEAWGVDNALNIAKRTAGGGLTYALGKLVAGFLNWLLGPAVGGGTFGFFMGMLVGLFEDLSIFLHLGEIFDAIKQMPQLIAQIVGNPGMIIEMLKGMILGHLTRCNLVSPYGVTDAPPGADPLGWWGERVVKWFWGENDPAAGADAVTFVVACTVGSIIGYLVQQFLIGTGIAKFAKELKSGGKFAELGKKLGDAVKPLKKAADKAVEVAKSVAKKFTRAAGEAADRFLKKVGLGGEDAIEGLTSCVAHFGAANSCKFDKIAKEFGADAETAARKMAAEDPEGWTKFCKRLCSDRPNAGDGFQLERTGHWVDNKPPGTRITQVDGAADVVIKNSDGSIWKTFDQKTSGDWSKLTDQKFRNEMSKTWGHAKQAYGLTDKSQLVFEFQGLLPDNLKSILTGTGYSFVDGL